MLLIARAASVAGQQPETPVDPPVGPGLPRPPPVSHLAGRLADPRDRMEPPVTGAGEHVPRNPADPLSAGHRRVAFARTGGRGDAVIARLSTLCTR